jgi:hypothetical protein
MRKKIKWIVLAVVVLVIVFAPVPIPHFTDFTSIYDRDGHEADVTIEVRLVHFKPLFFQYGTYEGFPMGSIKVYDNSAKEEICNLRFQSMNSYFEKIHMALIQELGRIIADESTDESGQSAVLISYTGALIWDESFDNVVLAVSANGTDLISGEDTYDSFAYLASKKELAFDELVDLFYDYRGIFLDDSE